MRAASAQHGSLKTPEQAGDGSVMRLEVSSSPPASGPFSSGLMRIPTEPIGSIPRPIELIEAASSRNGIDPNLDALYHAAVRDTIQRFEETGSPVVTDGEQASTTTSGRTRSTDFRTRRPTDSRSRSAPGTCAACRV